MLQLGGVIFILQIDMVREAVLKAKIPAVYLWFGEERFFIREALEILKGFYLKDDYSGSTIEAISGRDFSPAEIVEKANTISFFNNRLVVVEDTPYFQDGNNLDLEPLLNYLSNPNPNTCLLFICENVNRGRKFYKAVERTGLIQEFASFKRLPDWQMWIRRELEKRGKIMTSADTTFFLEWVGHEPGLLCQELDKLVLYVGDKTNITSEDIKFICPRMIEATVFDLLDAVALRDAEKAIQRLREVLKDDHPLKVLTMLVRQIRLLLGAQSLRQKGGNQNEVGSAVGIRSPYEAQKIWQQSQKLAWDSLALGLCDCLYTEQAIKTGGGEPELLLEMMVIRFCKG